MIGIYAIVHDLSGRMYVGSTTASFDKRFKEHKRRLNGNRHENSYLQNTWNKYNGVGFTFKILKEILDCKLVRLEEQIILDSLSMDKTEFFNLSKSASGGNTITNSEVAKRHKEGLKRSYENPELIEKRRNQLLSNNPQKFVKYDDDWRRVQTENNKRISKDPKWLKIVRERAIKMRKPVINDLGEIFESVAKASEIYKTGRSNIRANINGKTKKAANRIWKYYSDDIK
jgi:group I intron endonuclease